VQPDIPCRVSGYSLDQLLPDHGFNLANEEWLLHSGGGKAEGWLMFEFGCVGDKDKAIAMARACEAELREAGAIDSML
jgi:hypothetical protein